MSAGFFAAWRATLLAIVTDRYAVVTMIGAVILYSFFYPSAYRHEVASDLPIVVVDQDASALSRALLRRVQALREVRVVAQATDLDAARRIVQAREADALLYIPRDFARDVLRGQQGPLVLLAEGAYLGRASWALTGLAAAVGDFAAQAAGAQARFLGAPMQPPVRLVQRPLFNTHEGYGSSIVPGVSILIVHQTLLIGIGVLLGTRRQATGRRLSLPPRRLLGMLAGFATVGLGGMLYYLGFTAWVQDYPRGGNLPGLLVAAPLLVAATVLFGTFVGSYFDTRERAFQYVTATSIPLFFLANLSWPDVLTPPALHTAAQALPIVPGINLMVRLNQMGVSLHEVRGELWTLAGLVLGYGLLVCWRFRPQRRAVARAALPAPAREP
ncbi:ABC transporter permease [Verticiella sediminum]|uniref:ABC transporter permease n=1 Tax=Verticiella sediminum TaxID=1247510 RepID=A0A556AYA7_9BURK|nr:ABC transporter permease [Verticiella sediminum]TSH97933.1 ABC transporter permease [Verticiella sediminum]